MNSFALRRFFKYSLVGVSTFCFDIFLLFVFVDIFLWHPVAAAGIAFVIAISLNYSLSRRFVFCSTLRSSGEGYAIFLGIAAIGLLAVMLLMGLFVSIWHFNYILSRIIIASIVGVWNYLMNLFVNFKVAGEKRE